ncbi:CLUMA_CG006131, isoform A [Clunio marinus]|uniref:CLUMA_CG006131, isoform A n=1 Tax=Clunio marinus TaxID=568069 RepID=A0A1J1HZ26_9DIPT|nr:CLUMA_CG006131, isoform A [Clunio marinus]
MSVVEKAFSCARSTDESTNNSMNTANKKEHRRRESIKVVLLSGGKIKERKKCWQMVGREYLNENKVEQKRFPFEGTLTWVFYA